jgi:phosphoribosylanthranilate isomerase
MLVKICGIRRLDDAMASVELGADAIGFVFWPGSPRFIDPFRARAIARELPAFVTVVGVFVNQPESYVNDVASLVALHAVQLHGDEPVDYAARVERPVIKAIASGREHDAGRWPARVTVLVDAADPLKRGGTGMVADWTAAAKLARTRHVLLAGGLNAENVGRAIAAVAPFGIDVSSGVEAAPGEKDHSRLSALFAAVRQAQATHMETQR